MNIDSLEFWQQVKSEYNTSYNIHFAMCFRSVTFENAWDNADASLAIYSLAHDFLEDTKRQETIGFHNFLFKHAEPRSKDAIKLRKDFIEWCIERFTLS